MQMILREALEIGVWKQEERIPQAGVKRTEAILLQESLCIGDVASFPQHGPCGANNFTHTIHRSHGREFVMVA